MEDVICTSKTVGGTSRSRQLAGAAALLLGAVACGGATLAGWPLYQTLILLGAAATVAWLVSGSSRRFMGPGLAALAVGSGITLYNALDMNPGKGEHAVVYPMLGAALLVASLFNPMAIRGIGAFLLIVGAIAFIDTPWNPGWTLTAVLVSWAVADALRISRTSEGIDRETLDLRAHDDQQHPVGALR